MVLSPTSKIKIIDQKGHRIQKPREWTFLKVELELDDQSWERAVLTFQSSPVDIYMKKSNGRRAFFADLGRLSVGHYSLQLLDQDHLLEHRTFTVTPVKINEDAYSQLLEDLLYRLPVDLTIRLNKQLGYSDIHFVSSDEWTIDQEILRLERCILGISGRPGLMDILPRLAAQPYQVLQTTEELVHRNKARRPHPNHVAAAFRAPGNIRTDGLPHKIVDQRSAHTLDVYENQLVKLYSHQVHTRLKNLITYLSATKKKQYSNVMLLFEKMELALRSATFLDSVSFPRQVSHKPTMVQLKIPAYRAILEGFIEFHKTAIASLDEPALQTPLQNLPKLYELWGTLNILDSLLDVCLKLGFELSSQQILHRHRQLHTIQVLKGGRPALILKHPETGTTIRAIPQREYGKQGNLFSISYKQQPDLAIEITKGSGEIEVLLFDPKYKLDSESVVAGDLTSVKPQKQDIDKMHAYRDAIRDSQGNRVVSFCAILYPGNTVTYSDELMALRTVPTEPLSIHEKLTQIISRSMSK